MRSDVLDVLADQLLERAAHPLASFTTMDEGAGQRRGKLDGVRAVRKYDLDREEDPRVRAHDRKVQTEIRRLMKMRARHKKPEVYRAAGRAYDAANKERRRQQRIARYWKNRPKMLAQLKASREKHAEKRRAECLAYYYAHRDEAIARMRAYYCKRPRKGTRKCSLCSQRGHNRVTCARRSAP